MKYFIYTIIGIVTVAIVGGFFIVGSPQEARFREFDNRRVNDLQSIQWQIVNHWQLKAKLPKELSELRDDIGGYIPPVDPEAGKEYTYTVKQEKTAKIFELCATFNRPSTDQAPMMTKPYPIGPGGNNDNWQHGEGKVCFERTIDEQMYPTQVKPVR